MHRWGDDWPYWDKLNEAVEKSYELCEKYGFEYSDIKEKYGTLRLYCFPETDPNTYRKIYSVLVNKYPEIAPEIICGADDSKLLIGLVPQDKCNHGSIWVRSDDSEYCGICGKEINHDEE